MVKKVKLVKRNPGPSTRPLGVNPMDPWGAKVGITEASEAQLLARYLDSRGINPEFVSKETKIAHSKSGEYLKWRKDHEFREQVSPSPTLLRLKALKKKSQQHNIIHTEEVDKKDTITLDIPFMIRVLEYAREDAKDDMALHKVVEKLIELRNKGTLTMDDYDFVTKIKEEYELSEGKMKDIVTDREEKSRLAAHERGGADAWYGRKYSNPHEVGSIEHKAYHQGYHGGEKGGKDYGVSKGAPQHSFREAKTVPGTALDRFRAAAAERAKKHNEIEKQRKAAAEQGKTDVPGAVARLAKALGESVLNPKDPHGDYKEKSKALHQLSLNKDVDQKVVQQRKLDLDKEYSKFQKEDVYQDSQAATQTVFDGGNNTNDCCCNMKKERSKSARIIKALYKKKGVVKEDMYDHEKEDKSVQTYGKKPKTLKMDPKSSIGENKPDAAVVMSGGTTMTGEKRDSVEIDPMMKQRPKDGQSVFNKEFGKKGQ